MKPSARTERWIDLQRQKPSVYWVKNDTIDMEEREREIWKKPTRQWTNQSKTIDQINQNEQNLQFQRT